MLSVHHIYRDVYRVLRVFGWWLAAVSPGLVLIALILVLILGQAPVHAQPLMAIHSIAAGQCGGTMAPC